MGLSKSEKESVISEVSRLVTGSQTVVLAEYRGVSVADMTRLRANARSAGVALSVVKNTLARKAVQGSVFEPLSSLMKGPLLYGFSSDAVAAAKVVTEFAKQQPKFIVQGGAYQGTLLNVEGVQQLANIPSREVLLGQLLGLMQSPISGLARVLSAVAESRAEATAAPAA
ncbi:50S ribosomal protein L10 [Candidatus Symbiobacter mobilis]|uniref:50S ribosomal protein L10 n=1 Tax=Candidatus Symbiobacter mobilis TaxID=1436290 RepID=UPI00059BB0D0|nr:50S ribosomal protein L10 [Candidatus Symbiobacter mobilis]